MDEHQICRRRIEKPAFAEETLIEPGYLYYQILSENSTGNNKHYERVQNPLAAVYEGPAENGAMAKTTVTKVSGEILIRFQYGEATKSIVIYKPELPSLNLKPIYHAVF